MALQPIVAERSIENLTGLSRQTLGRWRSLGIFEPADDLRWAPTRFDWAYSLENAVMLRVLATLRREHRVPMDEIGRVAGRLATLGDEAWGRRLWVVDRRVLLDGPAGDAAGRAAVIDIGEVKAALERDAAELRRRDPATYGKVTRNRHINRNQWSVAGAGVMTKSIRELAEDGYDEAGILKAFPALVPADIAAALEHERSLTSAAA